MTATAASPTPRTNGASPTGELAPPQTAADFEGMATEPFSDEIRRILAAKPDHDDVEVKPDGICYMPGVWYRRQLTKAFGAGGWALKPNAPVRTMEGSVLWSGSLYALGRWVGEAVGGCDSSYMAMADRIQSAKTDCLSKICGHGLAMASELWDKTWREAWMEAYTVKEWREAKGQSKARWVYSLKKAREPRAANLMGEPEAPQDAGKGAPISASAAIASIDSVVATERQTSDTGEAASPEAYEAIASLFRSLKLKRGPVREFLSGHFGVEVHTALTATQADAAHALLMAWGKPVYEGLLAKLREAGTVRL